MILYSHKKSTKIDLQRYHDRQPLWSVENPCGESVLPNPPQQRVGWESSCRTFFVRVWEHCLRASVSLLCVCEGAEGSNGITWLATFWMAPAPCESDMIFKQWHRNLRLSRCWQRIRTYTSVKCNSPSCLLWGRWGSKRYELWGTIRYLLVVALQKISDCGWLQASLVQSLEPN